MANRINFNIGFKSDMSSVMSDLENLKRQLNDITTNQLLISDEDFKPAIEAAKTLKQALTDSFDSSIQNIDLGKFSDSLRDSGQDLTSLANKLKGAGYQGNEAFKGLANVVTNAQVPVKKTSQLLDDMWVSLKNIAKWNISTSILNSFQSSIQKAYYYSKDLNESLNNIRIVTGKSKEEMRDFAETANNTAKALNAATTSYTDASLIYYQQGLSDKDVQARTDVTIKAANVARTSAEQMSEYLTAIWNGYKVDASEAELYVDKVSAVAASTASDLAELSEGFSKVASAANTMGVDVDELNAYLATVISTTREAPETIGTAFKTIFARLNSISLGEEEDGWGLSTVGKTLEKIGIQLADEQGKLRDTGDVIDEIGEKWNTMTKETQQAVAVAMAGRQQYSRLIALFDNWDQYKQTLLVSQNAEGALQEQADIYAESWKAASQRVSTSLESIYQKAIDSDFFIEILNNLDNLISGIDKTIDRMGGFGNVLTSISGILAQTFNKQLAKTYNMLIDNISVFTGMGNSKSINMYSQMSASIDQFLNSSQKLTRSQQAEFRGYQDILAIKSKIVQASKNLTEEQINEANSQVEVIAALEKQNLKISEHIDLLEKDAKKLKAHKDMLVTGSDYLNNTNIFGGKNNSISVFSSKKGKKNPEAEKHYLTKDQTDSYRSLVQQRKNAEGNAKEQEKIQQRINKLLKQGRIQMELSKKAASEILKEYESQYKEIQNTNDALAALNASGEINEATVTKILEDYKLTGTEIEKVIFQAVKQGKSYDEIKALVDKILEQEQTRVDAIDAATPGLESQKQAIRDVADTELEILNAERDRAGILKNIKTLSDTFNEAFKGAKVNSGQLLADLTSVGIEFANINNMIVSISEAWSNDDNSGLEKFLTIITQLTFQAPQAISSFFKLSKEAKALSGTLSVAAAGATGLKASVLGVSSAVAAAAPWLIAIGVALSVVTAGITIYNEKKKEEQQARLDNDSQLLESIKTRQQETESVKSAVVSYQELIGIYKATGDVSSSIKDSAQSLIDVYGDEGTAIALLTNDYDALTAAIQKNIEAKNAQDVAAAQGAVNSTKDTLNKKVGDKTFSLVAETESEAKELQNILEKLGIEYDTFVDSVAGTKAFDISNLGASKVYDLGIALQESGRDWTEWIANWIDAFPDIFEKAEDEINNYKQAQDDLLAAQEKDALGKIFTLDKNYADMSLESFIKLRDEGISALESLGLSTEEAEEKMHSYLNSQGKTVSQLELTNKAIDQQIQLLKQQGIQVSKEDFLNLYNSLDEEGKNNLLTFSPKVSVDWNSFKEEFSHGFTDAVAGLQDQKDVLSKAWDELFDSQEISEETYNALIEKFPELEGILQQGYQVQVDTLKAYISAANNAISEGTQTNIDSAQDQLQYLQDEYNKMYSWMDKYPELLQQLIDANKDYQDALYNASSDPVAAIEAGEKLEKIKAQIQGLAGDDAVVDIDLNPNFTIDKDNLEGQIDDAKDQLADELSDPLEISVDLALDELDNWIDQTDQLAEAASKIGEGYRIAADDIDYFSKVYPELLDQATAYKDGSIQLNQEVVDSFLAGKQEEIAGEKDAVVAKLQGQKTMLEAKLAYLNSQLELANQLANGEITSDQYAQASIQNAKDVTSKYIAEKYGDDAAQAFDSATNQSDYISQVGQNSDAATDAIATNFWQAYDDANLSSQKSASNQINALNAIQQAAVNASAAVAGVGSGTSVYNPVSPRSAFQGSISGKKYDYNNGKNIITKINENKKNINDLEGKDGTQNVLAGLKAKQKELDKEWGRQEQGSVRAEIDAVKKAISGIDASILKAQSTLNKTGSAIKGAGKKGGSGSSGGGGKEKELKQLDDEIDKYHEINRLIEDNNRLLEKASKLKSRLYGSNYLKALEEETESTKKAQELEKQKLALIEQNLEIARQQANAAGANIDATGQISNYYEFLTNKLNSINARIQAGTITEEELEAEKEAYELTKSLFEAYEEEFDLYLETLDKIDQYAQDLADKQLEKVTKEVEFKLEISDDSMKVLDYFINKNKDFYELAEKYNLMTQKYQEIPNQLETYYNGILQLQEQLNDPNADHDAINQQIREYRDGMISSLEAMNELEEEMKTAYADALDRGREKLEDYTNQLNHVNDSLNHFVNILGLMGKEDAYDTINQIYNAQIVNGKNQLAVQKEMLAGYKEQQELLRQTGMEGTDDWFALVDAIAEAENELYETTESTLEAIGELYENTVKKIIDSLDKALSGSTLDELSDSYDRYSDEQDRFLTKTTQLYEITKLSNEIQQEIDATDNPARKQKLKDLQAYVNALGEQNKLSEYELEYAQAKYDLTLKEMALEEAKNSKTNLRLVRNSQGNWTYQYTADQDNIANAQQEYQDALNNLYKMSLDRVSELEKEIISINEEMKEALEGIERDNYETAEEYEAALLEVRNFYQKKLYDVYDQYNIARRNLEQDTYDLTLALTNDAILAGERAKEGYNQNIAEMIERLCGEGEDSFVGATDIAIEELVNNWQEWKDAVDEVAEFVELTEDDIIDKTGELTDSSNELKDTIVGEVIPAIMSEIEAVRQEVLAFNNAKAALANLKAMYENFISTLKIAEGQAKATAEAIDRSSAATGTLTSNKGGSSGGDGGGNRGGNTDGGPKDNPDPPVNNNTNTKAYYTASVSPWIGGLNSTQTRYSTRAACLSAITSDIKGYGKPGVTYTYTISQHSNGKVTTSKGTYRVPGSSSSSSPKGSNSYKNNRAFDTGGYTGDWGTSDGKIAVLHQKELVLNAADTRNMLKAVKVTREMAPSLKAIENEMNFKVLRNMSMSNIANLNIPETQGELQQSVRIEASFPNVSNSNEIETAFNNLINEAAQFAKRR